MTTPTGLRPATLLLLMILVALNLRPALSSLAPLLSRVQESLSLSPSTIGALTTVPVLCLGLFAPLAPRLSRRLGLERTLSLALLLLAAALLLRAQHQVVALFAGTMLAGAAIGIGGTLLPVLVKREMPERADLMTGVYTMSLCLGGAFGAGLSVPLAQWLGGWAPSIASWSALAVVALLAWRLLVPHPWPSGGLGASREKYPGLARNPLAWQVTGLMGLQSSLAYIVFGWLPTLLQLRGIGESLAGTMLGVSVLMQIFSALAAPWLGRLGRDQRPALLCLLAMSGGGLVLALVGPDTLLWPSMILLGLGQGGCFSLALTLLVLRSSNPAIAAQLSGMAQGIGYCIAALGPFAVGLLLDLQVSLGGIGAVMALVVALAMLFGVLAGRRLQLVVDEDSGAVVTRPHGR
ncbi:CynX/NimT family MFS transporter [Parahaliea mediterranea]|uniref:MFS transporter n=1 Tax=Parahaliea mediterranea TaxID=651086 RepID=A0A939DHD0_9GAMM|nr:MFS transporter [Parahaliea mediterranea]MBN7798114.1 MFS transporter [Parahaliea mediterranea]